MVGWNRKVDEANVDNFQFRGIMQEMDLSIRNLSRLAIVS